MPLPTLERDCNAGKRPSAEDLEADLINVDWVGVNDEVVYRPDLGRAESRLLARGSFPAERAVTAAAADGWAALKVPVATRTSDLGGEERRLFGVGAEA